jgi:hypothetical protein
MAWMPCRKAGIIITTSVFQQWKARDADLPYGGSTSEMTITRKCMGNYVKISFEYFINSDLGQLYPDHLE